MSQPHLAQPDVNPSFTKGIFLGELNEDLVLPFPTLSSADAEAQRMILDSFHSWAKDAVGAVIAVILTKPNMIAVRPAYPDRVSKASFTPDQLH